MAELFNIIQENLTNVKPLVTLGGVPIIEQSLTWTLSAGVIPYSTQIVVPIGALNDQIPALSNPTFLEIKMFIGVGGEPVERTIKFEKIIILEPREISEFEVQWTIADVRYLFTGKKCFFGYNMTRIKNDLGTLQTPTQALIGEVDPSTLRIPYDTFKKGRYLTNSVKGNGSPFTMVEILEKELVKFGVPVLSSAPFAKEKSYILENVEAEGEEAFSCIEALLAKSRLNLGIRPDGSLYVFCIDFFDNLPTLTLKAFQDVAKTSPGSIYKQDLKRIRPSKIKVCFEKLIETRVKLSPPLDPNASAVQTGRSPLPSVVPTNEVITSALVSAKRAIACINVIRVPLIPTSLQGKIDIGEYMPIVEYINALGLTEAELQKFWWDQLLEYRINVLLGSPNLQEIEAISYMVGGAIKEHYRQVFMIDPFHLDNIKTWETRRCTVVDNYSGYRPPSPLWADFTIFPRGRDVLMARGRVLHFHHARVYRADRSDPGRERPTLGTISVVDHDLGIFSVSYPSTSDTMVAEVVPSAIKDDGPFVTPALSRPLLADHPLDEDFTLETLISVIWNFDKDNKFDTLDDGTNPDGKYFTFNFDYSTQTQAANGPPITFLCKKEYARIKDIGVIQNYSILKAIAEAEAAKLYNQFIDRFVGYVAIPGIVSFFLDGNCKNVSYSLGPSGIQTIIDMMEIPFSPQLEQQLPDFARQYLFAQLPRGGP